MRIPDDEYKLFVEKSEATLKELEAKREELEALKKLYNEEIETLKAANRYYVGKLDALPKWFKMLYPNSYH